MIVAILGHNHCWKNIFAWQNVDSGRKK